jgi:hypothetical protein
MAGRSENPWAFRKMGGFRKWGIPKMIGL